MDGLRLRLRRSCWSTTAAPTAAGAALDALQREHPDRITVIHLSRNFGHQAALTAGMDHADGDAVICLDADMQHPPELIPQLVARWEEGFDIVQATRRAEPTASWFKQLTARAFYALINRLSATRIEPNAADFRLLSRRVVEVFKQDLRERDRFVRGLVRWVGFSYCTVDFAAPPRFAGHTHYSLRRMVSFARTGLISFSKAPLKVAVVLGFSVSALSLALRPVRDLRLPLLQRRHPRLGVDRPGRHLPRRLPAPLPRPHRRVHRHHLRRDQSAARSTSSPRCSPRTPAAHARIGQWSGSGRLARRRAERAGRRLRRRRGDRARLSRSDSTDDRRRARSAAARCRSSVPPATRRCTPPAAPACTAPPAAPTSRPRAGVPVLLSDDEWRACRAHLDEEAAVRDAYARARREAPLTVRYFDWWVDRMLAEIPAAARRSVRRADVRRRRGVPPPAGALHRRAGARPRRRHGRAGGARSRAPPASAASRWCAAPRRACRCPTPARRSVVVQGALHHARPVLADVLREIHRILQPGGVLVGSEPANDHPLTRAVREWQYRHSAMQGNDPDEEGFDRAELADAAAAPPACASTATGSSASSPTR